MTRRFRVKQADLAGDPFFLFSYKALRQLSLYYIDGEGDGNDRDGDLNYDDGHSSVMARKLVERLNAAEDFETQGNDRAKVKTLEEYRRFVKAHTGKALTPAEAHVLNVLSETL